MRRCMARWLAAIWLAVALGMAPAEAQESVAELSPEQVEAEVIEAVADYFGLPVEEVDPETDLLLDLSADPMDALELLGQLCAHYGVPLPEQADLTDVWAIASYLVWASQLPPEETGGVTRGGKKETEAGASGAAGDDRQIHRQTIFYATSRAEEPGSDPNQRFGGRRSPDKALSYGVGEVSIPIAVHRKGQVERPDLLKVEFTEDPQKHVVLLSLTPLAGEEFLGQVGSHAQALAGDAETSAFVFIHGFNVPFAKAARRVAQMTYDLEFPGAPILYSWPSDGRLLSYLSDREDVEWSVPFLERLLTELLRADPERRLHLIAHSMGNQALIRALDLMALRRGQVEAPLFANVILAAPDFDAGNFADHIGARVRPLAARWTIYTSDQDHALTASKFLAVERLGAPLTITEGMDTIDASGLDVAPWSVPEFHSYYASKQRVISDLVATLRGLAPAQRALEAALHEGLTYWKLK